MSEYKGKPVPDEAEKVGVFHGYDIYAIGLIRLLVNQSDKDKIVTHQYVFDTGKESSENK